MGEVRTFMWVNTCPSSVSKGRHQGCYWGCSIPQSVYIWNRTTGKCVIRTQWNTFQGEGHFRQRDHLVHSSWILPAWVISPRGGHLLWFSCSLDSSCYIFCYYLSALSEGERLKYNVPQISLLCTQPSWVLPNLCMIQATSNLIFLFT